MNIFKIEYENLKGMANRPFSSDYQKWIIDHVNEYIDTNIKIKFTDDAIEIDYSNSNPLLLLQVSLFIGYAFGQADNGR